MSRLISEPSLDPPEEKETFVGWYDLLCQAQNGHFVMLPDYFSNEEIMEGMVIRSDGKNPYYKNRGTYVRSGVKLTVVKVIDFEPEPYDASEREIE